MRGKTVSANQTAEVKKNFEKEGAKHAKTEKAQRITPKQWVATEYHAFPPSCNYELFIFAKLLQRSTPSLFI